MESYRDIYRRFVENYRTNTGGINIYPQFDYDLDLLLNWLENDDTYRGGYGAYATGNISLNKNYEIHVVVGGKGNRCICHSSIDCCGENGGYNGGGKTLQYKEST